MSKLPPGEFSRRVWALVLTIPVGKVTTYGLLTIAAGGHPMMSQMITHILSKSPDVDRIPFHRIVCANGRPWLSQKYEKKRLELYKKEGVELDSKGRIVDFDKKIYYFPQAC